jgi:hypothetical protein
VGAHGGFVIPTQWVSGCIGFASSDDYAEVWSRRVGNNDVSSGCAASPFAGSLAFGDARQGGSRGVRQSRRAKKMSVNGLKQVLQGPPLCIVAKVL